MDKYLPQNFILHNAGVRAELIIHPSLKFTEEEMYFLGCDIRKEFQRLVDELTAKIYRSGTFTVQSNED